MNVTCMRVRLKDGHSNKKNKKIYFRKGVKKMKKFTKLFLSCAAVAAVTAAVATSAMAAEKTLTAEYNAADGATVGTVTIKCASTDVTRTLLILKPNADKTNIAATDILQIDQADDITTATVPLLSEENEADKGTYYVLMGGESGDVYVGSFKIGAPTVRYGEVTLNDEIVDFEDAILILQSELGKADLTEQQLLNANVVGVKATVSAADVDFEDAIDILKYELGKASETKTLREAAGLPVE